MSIETQDDRIREAVRLHYAAEARRAQAQSQGCGCGCGSSCADSSAALYDPEMLREVPQEAAIAALGCGNPMLLADLKPGEVVLDLGSGGGIDVLLSARRVGPTGKAYGLDMTDEMLDLARENARRAGLDNVEFLKGHIEDIPLPDASVDVVISNCVINLSADKRAVLAEAFRVLKPGGRFAVADIVVQGPSLPERLREAMALWSGCLAGALTEDEYRAGLADAGFTGIDLEVLQDCTPQTVSGASCCCGTPDLGLDPGTRVISAFVKATRPAA